MATFNDLDDGALVTELARKQHELVTARFAHSMSRLENTATLGGIRKDIARIQTELRRRELAAGLPKDSLAATHKADPASLAASSGAGESGGFLSGVVDKLSE